MSASANFWANVRYLYSEHVLPLLTGEEKRKLSIAVEAASTSNVLTGTPAEASAFVRDLVQQVQKRREKKSLQDERYRTWLRVGR